jgi:beta-galactosidase
MRRFSGFWLALIVAASVHCPRASAGPGQRPSMRSMDAPAALLPVRFDATCFNVDGKPVHLISGEFHYFRVPKKDWKARMELFKQAGGNCIATYVPWLLHEPEEGKFVFGSGDGVHDLEDFLKTAKDEGLYVIARPGPYQYSELKYGGLPGWLVEKHPEIRAKTWEGKDILTESVSFVHPVFLAGAKAWFDRVCPILARYTVANGGPVAFVQLDNEVMGMHLWNGSLDYNPVSMGFGKKEGRYPQFLWRKFGSVEKLNFDYGTQYTSFQQVKPPKPEGETDEFELRRRKDYFEFYLETTTEYFQTLASWIRAAGIEVPLVHNSGNPDMNALFVEMAGKMGKTFLLGSDHYYNLGPDWAQNNPTPQYALNVFYSLEMLRLMGYPPTVFEMPSGSCADWPPVTPEDARACYFTNLAFGMKGHNYYIFTGGPNPPGAGVTTDLYDYGAPVGAKGEIRPLYAVQKDLAGFLQKYPWLAEARREFDCRFALDFECARSRHFWKARGKYDLTGDEAWEFLRRGALTSALCAGLSPVFCDLGSDAWLSDVKTPVVVVSSPSMSAAKQMRIVEFLKKGGRILLLPVVPTLDDRFNSCNILQEFLGKPVAEPLSGFTRVGVGPVVNVMNGGLFAVKKLPARAETVSAEEFSKKPVAWRLKTEGNGEVIVLGMRWNHSQNEQQRMMRWLLESLGLKPKVVCSNPNVWTSLRVAGNKAMLFLVSLYSAPMETDIQVFRTASDKPSFKGKFKLNAMEVKTVELKN